MLITLKTLQEDLFTVEIDPLQTVKRFKEKIEEVKGQNYPAKYIKLMYAGKFLLDGNRVCDYNLEEKKFVIAVVKEPKKPVSEEEHDPNDDLLLIPAPPNGAEQARASGNHLSHEAMVQHISELGFTRGEAEHALRTCFNNPDRAVEFLMGGVSGSRPDAGETSSSSNGMMPTVEEANASFLRHICRPDFSNPNNSILPSEARIFELFSEVANERREEEMRHGEPMAEANEDMMESYPGLDQNTFDIPDAFGSGMDCSSSFGPSASATPRAVPAGSYSEFQQSARYESLQTVQPDPAEISEGLFEGDQEAIERLKQLGFPDQSVIEAYFVCDKNENAAADYLFSQYD